MPDSPAIVVQATNKPHPNSFPDGLVLTLAAAAAWTNFVAARAYK